jgi:phage baseplate assembly protein W
MADFYDIDNTFTLDSRGDISLKTDSDAIRQSIRHIIFTATGAKPGFGQINNSFGVGVNGYLFAPLTDFTARTFSEAILRHLETFEPRITIINVDVQIDSQDRTFEVKVEYYTEKASNVDTFRTIINQI